jgi:hypothetical protein
MLSDEQKRLGIDWEEEPAPANDLWDGPIDMDEVYAHNNAARKAFEEECSRPDPYSGKSTAQIIREHEQKLAEQEAAALPAKQIDSVHQFLVEHPEFVCTPKNQQRIDQYFAAAVLNGSSPDHFVQAYRALASRGLMIVDESKRPRTPRKQLTNDDLYEMPLEKLEELARRR